MKTYIKRLTNWRHWPYFFFYLPISFAWILCYIKSRSFWFFTAANPTITFGGFEGEAKSEIYKQLPQEFCPLSIYIHPTKSFKQIVEEVEAQGIKYPFIVKPDIGMKGILFRKILNEQQLHIYHHGMIADYIIQEYIDKPYEISVFYYRHPMEENGRISAMIQKILPEIQGDGISTLEELLHKHSFAKYTLEKLMKQHKQYLNHVLKKGETYILSHIGNLVNGATFLNLSHLIDNQLLLLFDKISHSSQFYYGRYDIKCASIDELKEGRNFAILEFNGAGSIPNHIYTSSYTLKNAYKEIIKHWNELYEISSVNNKNGNTYWSFTKGYKLLQNSMKHFKELKKLDKKLLTETLK